jgi:hypothetical protein
MVEVRMRMLATRAKLRRSRGLDAAPEGVTLHNLRHAGRHAQIRISGIQRPADKVLKS